MSCPCSCSCKIFDLGVYDCSECLDLPLEAVQDGVHKFLVEWRNMVWEIRKPFVVGEMLSFPNKFNEDATLYFQIIQPDRTPLEYKTICNNVVTETYFNFSLSIKQMLIMEEETVTSQEVCGSELDQDGSKILICKTFE